MTLMSGVETSPNNLFVLFIIYNGPRLSIKLYVNVAATTRHTVKAARNIIKKTDECTKQFIKQVCDLQVCRKLKQ